MKIDIKKLKAAIHSNAADIKEMKSRQRESHQPRWNGALDYPSLEVLKSNATCLYILAAHLHGRQHLKTEDPEKIKEMKETAEYMMTKYAIKEEQTSSAPAVG